MATGVFSLVPRGPLHLILLPYVKALLIVAAGTMLRMWLEPVLQQSAPALTLTTVLIAAWVGGLPATLLAQTVAIILTVIYFGRPEDAPREPGAKVLIVLVTYYFVGILVALMSEFMQAAQRRAAVKAQEAISQREQLRATLSCIGDAVLVTDAAGRMTMMNPAAEHLIGWQGVEAIGRPLRDFFRITDEQSQQPAESPVTRVLSQQLVVHGDRPLLLAMRNGSFVPINYSAAPIRDAQGRITGIVVIVRDETERRHTEQELRDADRRKDEFLATLAHELRNPLAPICTGLSLLKLAAHEPETVEEVRQTMQRQTKHMVRLIDDLLDVSRITRGKLQLRQSALDLADVIHNAVTATRPFIDQGNHRLSVHLPQQAIWLNADPNRLTQVLTNLLHNAAKYTPPGGRIELSAERDNGQVRVTVADTGVGIPAEMQQQVFEMFAQVNHSLETGSGGLGIGLTLVKSLVELHGGTVEVHSDGLNRGCQFTVRLPALESAEAAEPSPPVADAVPASGRKLRVLVVDDNRDAAETLAHLVGLLGHEVHLAYDGEEAVAAATAGQPDVILMDLGMPKLNGYDAARQIRAASWGQELLLIATTGWGQEDDRRRTKEVGFDHHLVKPVEMRVLHDLLAGCGSEAIA